MSTATTKRVAGSAATAATLAIDLAADTAPHATTAEAKALHEAMALMKRARELLTAVSSGRVEARARFTMLKAA